MNEIITKYLKNNYDWGGEDVELEEILILSSLLKALPIREENKRSEGVIKYIDDKFKLSVYNDDLEFEQELLNNAIKEIQKLDKEKFYDEVIKRLISIVYNQRKYIEKMKHNNGFHL